MGWMRGERGPGVAGVRAEEFSEHFVPEESGAQGHVSFVPLITNPRGQIPLALRYQLARSAEMVLMPNPLYP